MESVVLQAWILFKWFLPAAIGSGLAVFIDKTENTVQRKIGLFIFGAIISIICGGACIEYFHITSSTFQGLIYWAWGVWGMGIVIQLTHQIPEAITNIREKYLK
jgi:undecaprenyl pyrophosphate phosphatase UppP